MNKKKKKKKKRRREEREEDIREEVYLIWVSIMICLVVVCLCHSHL